MKRSLIILAAALAGAVLSAMVVVQRWQKARADWDRESVREHASWQAERERLEAELAQAGRGSRRTAVVERVVTNEVARATPREMIESLRKIKVAGGSARSAREAIVLFENLAQAGTASVPAIQEFLARNEDIDYEAPGQRNRNLRDDTMLSGFLVPPSLRFGLLEDLRRIGGPESEKVLALVLGTTGRGAELAYVARTLEEMNPGKYREAAVAAAREMLNSPLNAAQATGLDKNDSEYLFGLLGFFRDGSFADQAKARVVRNDGNIDANALNYLRQVLGEQSVTIAMQAYQDPRITNSAAREPLARVALNYVGLNAQATDFYQMAINDLSLPEKHRKNLIEDLNETGFTDPKNLTAADLPLIQKRLALIEAAAPAATDPVNRRAFQEAYKDLGAMQSSLLPKPVNTSK